MLAQTKIYTLEEVRAFIELELIDTRDRLKRWKEEKFDVNPRYALEWSGAAFSNAVIADMLTGFLGWIDRVKTIGPPTTGTEWAAEAVAELDKDIDRMCGRNPSSTSVTSNLIEHETRIQACKLRDMFAKFAHLPKRF